MTPGKSFRLLLDRLIRTGSVLVAGVAALALSGWILDIPVFTRLLPGLPPMKVNTACAMLAAAAALWILHTRAQRSPWFALARALAGMVVVLGGLNLAQDLFALNLGIDQFILPGVPYDGSSAHPGRMSSAAAFNFVFIGLALLALKARRPKFAACSHWLVVPPLLVATLAVLGYAYGATSLYAAKPFASMAAHTAAAFFVLSLSVLAADSAHGFASIAISNTAGGLVSRRLLPTIPVMIFLLGWVRLEGQALGLYDVRFGSALMVLLSISVCVIAVASTATTLHKVDLTRKLAEAEILSFNVELESRVQERTRELAQVSSQLRLVNGALELLSQQDGLTGVANRRFFDKYLAEQQDIARRYGRTLALVLCDVDYFKAYNDHYGHQAGDECLKQIAAALRTCCRRSADMTARYGGEEFALILPETDSGDAARIAEAARSAVAQLRIEHGRPPAAAYVSISGGVAVLSRADDISAAQLIMAADQRLFEAKRLGRNRVVSEEAGAEQAAQRSTIASISSL